MAENIIIKVESDNKGLIDTITLLEKLGQIDKKTADEFRAANKAYEERLKATVQAGKAVDDLGKKTVEAGKKSANAFDGAKKGISGLDSALKSIAQGIGAAFAVQKIIAFGEASVQAFQEAEKNALLLKSAVSVNGGLQQDFEELIAQSEELQKLTIFSDDAIQRAQTAALQFGLTKDQVKALIPVITDFASATGQDLQTALDGVIQGINGVGRGLKIYGVTIDENGTRQSRLAEITDQLTKKFEGQAVAVGETASGALAKYNNQVDDLQEKVGEKLSPILLAAKGFMLDLADAALTAATSFGKYSRFANAATEDTKALIDGATKSNRQSIEEFKKSFQNLDTKEIEEKFNTLFELSKENTEKAKESTGIQAALYRNLATEQALQAIALSELLVLRRKGIDTTDEETAALNRLKDISKLTDKDLQDLLKTFDKFNDINAKDASQKIEKEIEARAKLLAKRKTDTTKKVADDEAKIRKELADKEFAQDEENLKKFVAARKESLVKQNLSAEDLEKELTNLELQELELRLKNLQDYGKDTGDIEKQIADFRVKNYLEANKKIQDSNDEMFKAYLQALEDNAEAEKKAKQDEIELNEKFAKDIESLTKDIFSSLAQITNNYFDSRALKIQEDTDAILEAYDKQIEANEDLHDKNKRGDREYEKQKKKLLDERTLAEKKADKELRKIKHDQAIFNRDIAILNTTLSTAQGIARAFADYPYPYDLVVAALVAGLGAAEIAVAASAPIPSYAKGVEKITGKGTETSDDVPARLSVGERVVKASTNRKYFPILSAIHNERFDPEAMNNFAKMSPDAIKMLAMVDKEILKDLTTLSPVFMKHESMKPIFMKKDSLSGASSYHQTIINQPSSLDEYDISRALDRGTHLKEGTIKQLAKEIGNQVKEKKNIGKSWR